MKKYRKIIVLFFIMIFTQQLYSYTNENIYFQKKDPFIAGLLSVTMLGLGHFYTKDYLKGSLFLLTDLLQKGMLVFLISNLNDKYTNKEKNDKEVQWLEVTDVDKGIILGFVAFYFGSRIYCIIDSMNSANKYNKKLEGKFSYNGIKFNPMISCQSLGFSLNKNF